MLKRFPFSTTLTDTGGVHNLQGAVKERIQTEKAALEGDRL